VSNINCKQCFYFVVTDIIFLGALDLFHLIFLLGNYLNKYNLVTNFQSLRT